MIKIELIGGPEDGREYKFAKSFKIGRDIKCDIPLQYDKFSSREHATVILDKNKCLLQDLNSTNGTFFGIGEDKIDEVPLKNNDIFRVGRVMFRISIKGKQ